MPDILFGEIWPATDRIAPKLAGDFMPVTFQAEMENDRVHSHS